MKMHDCSHLNGSNKKRTKIKTLRQKQRFTTIEIVGKKTSCHVMVFN